MGSKPSTAAKDQGQIEVWWDHRSPPSRCVIMTLKALNEKYVDKQIDLFKGENKSEAYLKINPLGKVPAIKMGSFTLNESKAIACFVCNKYNTPASKRLYPREPVKRAEVDRLLIMADGVMAQINKQINIFGVLFGGQQPDRDQMDEAVKAIDMVAGELGNSQWLTGDNMTIADFFVATPFFLYGICTDTDTLEEFIKHEGGDKVKNWLKRIKALPYFDEVNKKGLEAIKAMYDSKLQ